jgi:hypothetical protein
MGRNRFWWQKCGKEPPLRGVKPVGHLANACRRLLDVGRGKHKRLNSELEYNPEGWFVKNRNGESASQRIALSSPLTHTPPPLHSPENNHVASVPSHSNTRPAQAKAAIRIPSSAGPPHPMVSVPSSIIAPRLLAPLRVGVATLRATSPRAAGEKLPIPTSTRRPAGQRGGRATRSCSSSVKRGRNGGRAGAHG